MILLAWMMAFQAGQDTYVCKNARINLYSSAPIEDIEANSNSGVSVYNAATGELDFSVPIRSLHFPKALMEEHFNENYMESDKYPYGVLNGVITEGIDFTKDGTYDVTVKGTFEIHGVKQDKEVKGKLTVKNGAPLNATARFDIKLSDYKIKIPSLLGANISEGVKVDVNFNYEKYEKK